MTYEEYFEKTKEMAKRQLDELSESELVEYMHSEEDIIKNKYKLQRSQYEAGDKTAFDVSGVGYSLYMLYK